MWRVPLGKAALVAEVRFLTSLIMAIVILVLFFAVILWLFQGREDGPTRKEYEDYINKRRSENEAFNAKFRDPLRKEAERRQNQRKTHG